MMQRLICKIPALLLLFIAFTLPFCYFIHMTCSYFVMGSVLFRSSSSSPVELCDFVQANIFSQRLTNIRSNFESSTFRQCQKCVSDFPKQQFPPLIKSAKHLKKEHKCFPCLACLSVYPFCLHYKSQYSALALLQAPLQSLSNLSRAVTKRSALFPSLIYDWQVYGRVTRPCFIMKLMHSRIKFFELPWRIFVLRDFIITQLRALYKLIVCLAKFVPSIYFQNTLRLFKKAPVASHENIALFDFFIAEDKMNLIELRKHFYCIDDFSFEIVGDVCDLTWYKIFLAQPFAKKKIRNIMTDSGISSLKLKPCFKIQKFEIQDKMKNSSMYSLPFGQNKLKNFVVANKTSALITPNKNHAESQENVISNQGFNFLNYINTDSLPVNTEIGKARESNETVTKWYLQQFSNILEHIFILGKALNESAIKDKNVCTFRDATNYGKATNSAAHDNLAPLMEKVFDPVTGPILRFYEWEFAKSTKTYPKTCLIYGEADENALVVRPRNEKEWVSFTALNHQRRLTPESIGGLWFGKYNTSWDPILILASTSDLAITALLDNPKIIQSFILSILVSLLWLSREETAFLCLQLINSKLFWKMHPFWSRLLYAAPPFKLLLIRVFLSTLYRVFINCESVVKTNLIQLESHCISQTIQTIINTST